MANTARGGYQGARSQFPASVGQYYQGVQQQTQQQYQAYSYPYYGGVGGMPPTQAYGFAPQTAATASQMQRGPPPPPPPPGETSTNTTSASSSVTSPAPTSISNAMHRGIVPPIVRPLETPPLPPLFPWMSPALAQSMTGSQYGQKFKEEASNLPFVPIVVNDADLAKMTEKVMKEQEEAANLQMKFYKDVISQDLPKPLLEMFQPLYCKLCILTLSSPVVAKDHYNGKRHKKAIEIWFSKNPEHVTPRSQNKQSTPSTGLIKPINGYITPSHNGPTPPMPPQNPQQQRNTDRKRPNPGQPLLPLSGSGPGSIQNQNPRQRLLPSSNNAQPPPQIRPHNPNNQVPRNTNPNNSNFTLPNNNNNTQRQQQISPCGGPKGINNSNFNPNGDFQVKKPRWEESTPAGPPAQKGFQARGSGNGGGPPPKERCEICDVLLSSRVMADQHFKGKNHAARVAALKEGASSTTTTPTPTPTSSSTDSSSRPQSLLSQQIPPPIPAKSPTPSNSGPRVGSGPPPQMPPKPQPQTFNNSANSGGHPSGLNVHNHRGGGFGPGGANRGNMRGGSSNRGGRPPFNKNNSNNFQNSNSNNNRFNNSWRGGGGGPRFN